jgi:hypothetical protein
MNWYFMNGDKQEGPYEQEELVGLIKAGRLNGKTPVWRDGMGDWLQLSQTELSAHAAPKVPPPFTGISTPPSPPPPAFASSSSFQRDPNMVYPSNPPKSPNNCWWGLLLPGLPEMILGQGAKGAAICGVGLFLAFISGGASYILFMPANIVDAYKVGKVLASGRPVGKWEFFPS